MMIEVKGGNQENFRKKQVPKFFEQAEKFQEYMKLRHGTHLQNVLFYPVLAKLAEVKTNVLCSDFKFDIPCLNNDSQTLNMESIEKWWDENPSLSSSEDESLSAARVEEILKSLIFDTSLALMSLPSQLTRNSPDTLIILLRRCQWALLAGRPKNVIVFGAESTGKSTALELGMARIGEVTTKKMVIACGSRELQTQLRKELYEGTISVEECAKENMEQIIKALEKIDTSLNFVAIDDMSVSELKHLDVKEKLKEKMKIVDFLWIVVNTTQEAELEDVSRELGFQCMKFWVKQ